MNFPKNGGNPSGRAPRLPPPTMLANWANIDSDSITGMMGTTVDLPPPPPYRPPTNRQHANTTTQPAHTSHTNHRFALPSPPTAVADPTPPPPPPPPPQPPTPSLSPTPVIPTGATPLPFMGDGVGASTVMDWCTPTTATGPAIPQPPQLPTQLAMTPSSISTSSPQAILLSQLGGDTVLVCDSLQVSSIWGGGESCLVGTTMGPPPSVQQQPVPPQEEVDEEIEEECCGEADNEAPPAPPPSPQGSIVLGLSDGTSAIVDGLEQFSLSPFDESVITSIVDRVGRTVVLDFISAHTTSGNSVGTKTHSVLTPVHPNTTSSSATHSKPSTKATPAPAPAQPQRGHHHQPHRPLPIDETTPPTSKLASITSPSELAVNMRPKHRTHAYLNNGGKRPRDVDD